MALTLPTSDDLFTFWGDEADDLDPARADMLIRLSANLFWLATDVEDDPTDARLADLVKFAIMDMAIHLFVTRDDIDAAYSPAQSERIGSYSYSKNFGTGAAAMARQIQAGSHTGAVLFDRVVEYYMDQAFFGSGTVSSEQVFKQGFVPLQYAVDFAQYFGRLDDPSYTRSECYAFLT